jgi:hypothetical protein
MPRPGRFTLGKDPLTIVYEAEWAPGPVWMGAENFAPTEIRSPERSARRVDNPAHVGQFVSSFAKQR